MGYRTIANLKAFAVIAPLLLTKSVAASVVLQYPMQSQSVHWATTKLATALQSNGRTVIHHPSKSIGKHWDILVVVDAIAPQSGPRHPTPFSLSEDLDNEGFEILTQDRKNNDPRICIHSPDAAGAMYGLLDLTEQVRTHGSLEKAGAKSVSPHASFRAIKFNLPWSPYRSGPAMQVHRSTCRDLDFWEEYLDMMARNRFNVLTLWSQHPFPYLIRPENFPKATPFSDREMQQWREFWHALFSMAQRRNIDTYILNWNIVVSEAMADNYDVNRRNDTSDRVRKYTRECVTQTINEYPKLTGLGVTLADWMDGMSAREREDWIQATFVEGIKAADREARFIHRSVLTASPKELRRVIDEAEFDKPVWVPVKFNWSHGHSTPDLALTHGYTSGRIDKGYWHPKPTNYKIIWTVRNEDFFILRWGQPDFIRKHIAQNGRDYVGGYMVGSEGYIPAKDYSHKIDNHQAWQYAFQKQWLFYKLWGRLLYNPETPDRVFENAFALRYGEAIAARLFETYQLASRMPLRLASFHAGSWDFTLYSEGFLAAAGSFGLHEEASPFISINELIDHKVLDPDFMPIPEFVAQTHDSETEIEDERVTPIELAEESRNDAQQVLANVKALRQHVGPLTGALECELDDLEAWGHLSHYFADKLRAGVALHRSREHGGENHRRKALTHLKQCKEHWKGLVNVTRGHYRATPYVGTGPFHWQKYYDQVQRDIEIAED